MNSQQAMILSMLQEVKDSIEMGLIMLPQHQVKTVSSDAEAAEITSVDSEDKFRLALDHAAKAIEMLRKEFTVDKTLTTHEKFQLYFRTNGEDATVYEDETFLSVTIAGRQAPTLTFYDKAYAADYINQRVSDTGLIYPKFWYPVSGPF